MQIIKTPLTSVSYDNTGHHVLHKYLINQSSFMKDFCLSFPECNEWQSAKCLNFAASPTINSIVFADMAQVINILKGLDSECRSDINCHFNIVI